MEPFLAGDFANPSGMHAAARDVEDGARGGPRDGRRAPAAASRARSCSPAAAREADNLAVKGAAWAARDRRGADGVVTTAIEHKAVLGVVRPPRTRGLPGLERVGVGRDGRVDLDALADAARRADRGRLGHAREQRDRHRAAAGRRGGDRAGPGAARGDPHRRRPGASRGSISAHAAAGAHLVIDLRAQVRRAQGRRRARRARRRRTRPARRRRRPRGRAARGHPERRGDRRAGRGRPRGRRAARV